MSYNTIMSLLPQHSLVLEHFGPTNDANILLLEGGDGKLALEISKNVPEGKVLTLSRDIREIWSAENRLKDVDNASPDYCVYPDKDGWDYVILTIPKGRRYARSLLVSAWQILKPGGKLLMAGPTRKGAKAVISDAERLFGNVTVLGFRHHQRAAVCTRNNDQPALLPEVYLQIGIRPGTTYSIDVSLQKGHLTLKTHPGIFSWEKVDEGTEFLLNNLNIIQKEKVWDVGCGYGVLGLSAAKMGASQVLMTDVNLIAINYAGKNTQINHLDDIVTVAPSIGLTPPKNCIAAPPFDLILSNPAFHQGRNVDKSMAAALFSSAPGVITPNGRLVIVTNRFINYKRDMQKYFQTVTCLADNGKYMILEAHK